MCCQIFSLSLFGNMKDIIFDMINDSVEGVDIYHRVSGMWLIFTDEKKWVIELTKEGVLWYNHDFFQDIFKYISMNVIENQHYITEWVEDTIKNGVKDTKDYNLYATHLVESVIQNGVKDTAGFILERPGHVESVIQNGVKDTIKGGQRLQLYVEDTIQNGVKDTFMVSWPNPTRVEDTIQNGTKI